MNKIVRYLVLLCGCSALASAQQPTLVIPQCGRANMIPVTMLITVNSAPVLVYGCALLDPAALYLDRAVQPAVLHVSVIRGGPSLVARRLTLTDPGPTRFYWDAGPAPTDTVVVDEKGTPSVYDGVLYMDSADNLPKMLRRDGTVVVLGH